MRHNFSGGPKFQMLSLPSFFQGELSLVPSNRLISRPSIAYTQYISSAKFTIRSIIFPSRASFSVECAAFRDASAFLSSAGLRPVSSP